MMHFRQRILPFALTLLVGVSLASLLKHDNHLSPRRPCVAQGYSDSSIESSTGDERIFNARDVSRKAQVLDKPTPLYTQEARKNQITGTVTVRLVLNANGTVTNATAINSLPDGLTGQAIEAAQKIAFVPAEKDGRKVSQYATIMYNFNIY